MLKNLTLLALLGAATLGATSAGAQYYDPYGRPPPPRYDYDRPPPPRYDDERPRRDWDRGPRDDFDRSYRPRRFGAACVTSRGTCETRPAPIGAGCGCYFDGFGSKRGIIQ